MPNIRAHCAISRQRTGFDFEDLHKWIDHSPEARILGADHRIERHAYTIDDMEYIAAIAGIGDKVDSKELKDYIVLCKKNGFDIDHIKDVVDCLDYESFILGFIESRSIINDLLGLTPDKQKKLIRLIKKIADEKIKMQMKSNIKS